jgi:hypothetical protein
MGGHRNVTQAAELWVVYNNSPQRHSGTAATKDQVFIADCRLLIGDR